MYAVDLANDNGDNNYCKLIPKDIVRIIDLRIFSYRTTMGLLRYLFPFEDKYLPLNLVADFEDDFYDLLKKTYVDRYSFLNEVGKMIEKYYLDPGSSMSGWYNEFIINKDFLKLRLDDILLQKSKPDTKVDDESESDDESEIEDLVAEVFINDLLIFEGNDFVFKLGDNGEICVVGKCLDRESKEKKIEKLSDDDIKIVIASGFRYS